MNRPTLSIIMANYNHSQYLRDCLQSIVDQSLQPLEVLLTDDASTDNSYEIMQEFAKRYPIIKISKNEKNCGHIYTINNNLSLAKGDYIYSMSVDDIILPGFFEKVMTLLNQYPDAGLCCFNTVYIYSDDEKVGTNLSVLSEEPTFFTNKQFVEKIRKKYFSVGGLNSVIKRSALLEAGSFIPQLRWWTDSFVTTVIGFRYGIGYVPQTLAASRIVSTSYSQANSQKKIPRDESRHFMLSLLQSPAFADVVPLFNESGILSSFGMSFFILKQKRYSDLFTLKLLTRAIWTRIKSMIPSKLKKTLRLALKF